MILFGPAHLRAVLDEYVEHHNTHRPHRPVTGDLCDAQVDRREVLGGVINEYAHDA